MRTYSLFLAAALLPISGCVVSGMAGRATGSFEREIAVAAPLRLEVDSHSGSISVRGEETATVRIRAEIRATDWRGQAESEARVADIERDPPVDYRDGVLRIGRRVGGDRLDHVSIRYEIVVPRDSRVLATAHSGSVAVEDVAGPVTAKSHSGSVRASRIAGDLEVSAHSGSLRVEDIGGTVRASTHSGGHTIERVVGGVRSTAHSGSLRMSGIGGEVEARAHSGGVTLAQAAPAAAAIRVHSGSVEVTTVPGAGYDFDVRARSGSIRLPEEGTSATSIERGRVKGKLREGGPAITIETHAGGVRLN